MPYAEGVIVGGLGNNRSFRDSSPKGYALDIGLSTPQVHIVIASDSIVLSNERPSLPQEDPTRPDDLIWTQEFYHLQGYPTARIIHPVTSCLPSYFMPLGTIKPKTVSSRILFDCEYVKDDFRSVMQLRELPGLHTYLRESDLDHFLPFWKIGSGPILF